MGNICRKDYCSKNKPEDWTIKNHNWMKNINDNTLISKMSIPGTHNSISYFGGDMIQCQSWLLYDQFNSGIRFIDIRCRHFRNSFVIHHGSFYQHKNFNDVIDICKEFLIKNPTECIIMRIRKEHTEEENSRTFIETFNEYYNNNIEFSSLLRNIPNIGEIRKKIWIINNFDNSVGFKYNCCQVQDYYDVDLLKMDYKKNKIKIHLDETINNYNNKLYINFCSGCSGGAYPYTVARNTNEIIFSYFGSLLGIIVMDFPGEELIDHIILQN